jgi:hypothetical protein
MRNNCILTTDGILAFVENILENDKTIYVVCEYFAAAEDV